MKILLSYPYYYPAWGYGGITRSVYELSRQLAKRGHKVAVFTTDTLDKKTRIKRTSLPQNIEGVDIYYFKNISNYFTHEFNLSIPVGLILKINEEVKKYDIIHLHGGRSFQNILLSHYAKKNNIPYIVQFRGDLPYYGKKGYKKIYDYFWGIKILKNALKCIALTKTELYQYIKMGIPENNIVIIPNGVDISQYEYLPPRGKFRSKYQIHENERIILSLGRIHEIKGLDLLVIAFSQLCCQMNNVKLVIVGPDGGFLSQIQRQIRELLLENNVIFTGPLYGKDKLEAYVDADVFILPSRYEAFPNTVLEAWACGTPVILSDSCALSTIAQQAGIVVKRNPIDLAKAIKRLMLDETLRKNYSKRGQSLVSNELNIKTVVTQIEECYQQIILSANNMEKIVDENFKTKE